MSAKKNIILCILYGAIIIGFGFWWARHFGDFTDKKGDGHWVELVFVFVTTMVAGIIFKLNNRQVAWPFVVVMPFLIGIICFFILMFMLFLEIYSGTTVGDLMMYPIVHFAVAALAYGAQVKTTSKK